MGHMMIVILVTLLVVKVDHCTSGRLQYLNKSLIRAWESVKRDRLITVKVVYFLLR